MKQTQHTTPARTPGTPSTPAELTVGSEPLPGSPRLSRKMATKAKCLDCCGYVRSEVAKCTARHCPLWSWRLGTNPNRAPRTKKQQLASLRSGQKLAALKRGNKTHCLSPRQQPEGGGGPLPRSAVPKPTSLIESP